MNKLINCYTGDSLSIKCRIYDEAGSEFDSSAFEIDKVLLTVVGLDEFDGTINGNIAQVFIPAATLKIAGKYDYYLQVLGTEKEACFTVLAGTLNVLELPQ